MKTNLFKRVLAAVTVLTVVLSSALVANAYKDTSFPYSNNFEHWRVESWNGWLNPSYDTGLGATVYADANVAAQIVVDEDSTHNLVFYMSRPSSDTAERFIHWLLPAVSEGKFVLEFDAKTTGNGMWFTGRQENHSGSGEPRIMNMSENAITSGGNVISTYETGEWKSFKVLFDVETGDVTTFVDGKSATVNSSFFKTSRAMYFSVNAGATMSLDNIKTYLVDESVSPNPVLEENGENVGLFASDETDSFVLSLDNGAFGTLPEISVTCLGEDIMSADDDYDFEVSTQLSEGSVIITPDDYLEAGSRYAVTVADGTTDMFGRVIENTGVEFYVAENDGWITGAKYEESFNLDSVPTSGYFGTTGKFFNVDNANHAKIVTGDEYTDGKALSITNQTALSLGFPVRAKKGYVHVETGMRLNDGAYVRYDTEGAGHQIPLFYGQSNVDLTSDGVNDPYVSYLYSPYKNPQYHTDQYKYAMWEKRQLRTGLDTISYTIDMDTEVAHINHNGTEFSLDVLSDINNNAKLEHGIRFFRFQGSTANPLIIDYFNWSHEYQPAVVEEIEASTVTDGKVDVKSQIVIAFSESMKEDTLSNITVSDASGNAAYTGVWDAESLTYTLTFAEKLKGETKYTVTVPDTVKDFSGLQAKTAYGTFTTDVVPPMDVENLAATLADGDVTVTADVTNAVDGKVYLAVASYEGNVMQDMNYVAVDVTETSTQVSYTFEDLKAGSVVKAFALKDMTTITPYCTAVDAN